MGEGRIMESYNFIVDNPLSEYEGKWVAVVGREVVAADKNAKKAYSAAKRKYPHEEPLLDKVFDKRVLIV